MKERYVNVPGFTDRESFTDQMTAAKNDNGLVLIARQLDEIERGKQDYEIEKLVDAIADVCTAYSLTPDEMGVVLTHLRRSEHTQAELGMAL